MDNSSRIESLKERFSQPANRGIDAKWNTDSCKELLSGEGVRVSPMTTDLTRGIAVSLGSFHKYSTWMELRQSPEHKSAVLELNLVDGVTGLLGRTALVDSILLTPGDSINIGRTKYPQVDKLVSRNHVNISLSENLYTGLMTFSLFDLNSSNGTFIFDKSKVEHPYDHDERSQRTRADENNSPQQEKQTNFEDYVDRLVKGYGARFSSLSYVDFSVCLSITNHLKTQFPDSSQKQKLERELNKQLHPDRNAHHDNKVAHEMFLLSKELLGL